MTQFEYVTATSGVYPCECIGCLDVVYGYPSEYCGECESAMCVDSDSCQRDDVYEEC